MVYRDTLLNLNIYKLRQKMLLSRTIYTISKCDSTWPEAHHLITASTGLVEVRLYKMTNILKIYCELLLFGYYYVRNFGEYAP